RSMYVLDNIAPIRHAAEVHGPITLFAPPLATRRVDSATVQYSLASRADTVRIDILDHDGKLVRSFVGGGEQRHDSAGGRTAASRPDTAVQDTILHPTGCETPRRRGGNALPTGRAGLNTFGWDLRYPGAVSFECLIMWGGSADRGPLALPGQYTVRITAGSATASQPLTVRMDPRLKGITERDLAEQFALSMQIRDRVSAADTAVIRIRQMRSKIADRIARAKAQDVTKAGTETAAKLLAIEEALYQTQNRSGQDPLNFPIRINNRIAALGSSVESGDARPTAASYVVFKQLSAELDGILRKLDAVVASDVATFNATVKRHNLPPIV
ncbi:MAG TPA: hypothetical protein VN602_09935, partial [Gemmatimonadaceae bacterium]|nr:hypothetical protein [Gemmatimonadaceae bacterium]